MNRDNGQWIAVVLAVMFSAAWYFVGHNECVAACKEVGAAWGDFDFDGSCVCTDGIEDLE